MKETISNVAALVAMTAAGMTFAAEHPVTTDWATVSPENYADGPGDLSKENGWANQNGVGTVTNRVIRVSDGNAVGTLSYTPPSPLSTNGFQTVVVRTCTMTLGDVPEPYTGARGALAAVIDKGETNWCGWCAAGWTNLFASGQGQRLPDGGTHDVRIECDSRSDGGKRIRYSVRRDGPWEELKPEGATDGWLPDGAFAACCGRVNFSGNGAFDKIELTQTGTVTVDDTRIEKAGITAAELDKPGANGNPNWENLVLGLKCKDASSKPVVRPVQTGDPTTVTLALGGVDVDTASGATVKYTVTASDEIGGEGTTTQPVDYDKTAAMALPRAGVKYYRMKVVTVPR